MLASLSYRKDISLDVLISSLHRTDSRSRPLREDPSGALTWDPFCATPRLQINYNPPYNTGNDFIYMDDFAQSVDDYNEQSGMYSEAGDRLFKNTDSNGRFHSDWCSMIYPRLILARNILASDGAIFISIDDHESDNLKKICDFLFWIFAVRD